MKDRILRAKHWQLFILTFALPFLIYIIMFIAFIVSIDFRKGPDPQQFFGFFRLMPFIMILFYAVLFYWFWAVVTGLQSKIPEGLKINIKRFKVFYFFPIIYFLVVFSVIGFYVPTLFDNLNQAPNPLPMIRFVAIMILPHFFSLFCIMYIFHTIGKTLKTAELKRETSYGDFVGEFFLIWFFPVGVWFLQPRINKLMEGNKSNMDF